MGVIFDFLFGKVDEEEVSYYYAEILCPNCRDEWSYDIPKGKKAKEHMKEKNEKCYNCGFYLVE